ncbi:MAG: metallophosphoesterase [Acidimicrobiales bacterium]
MLRAVIATSLSTIVGTLLCLVWFDPLSFFGLAHIAYLGFVVTVPALCVGTLAAMLLGRAGWLGRRGAAIAAAGALVPTALGIYATHIEPYRLRLDRHDIELTGAGVDAASSLRIAVLSDVQTPHIRRYENETVDRMLAEDPDLVLIPGDLWQGTTLSESWSEFHALLARIAVAVPHVVLVEGDADFHDGLVRVAEGTTAHVLDDEVLELEIEGQVVLIAGDPATPVERPREGRSCRDPFPGVGPTGDGDDPALPPTRRGLRRGAPDRPRGLGPHPWRPGGAAPRGSAHHPVARAARRGRWGLHEVDGQPIYVSTGVGLERHQAPQLRFLVRPSVGILDLKFTG